MNDRVLKFRAWHKEHGMIYPHEHFSLQTAINGEIEFFGSPAKDFAVDDFTFLQYTGRKDKHKKDGYEGDIVKLFDRSLFIIVWDEYYARFQLDLVDGYHELHKVYALDMLQFGEIVGNIYEHPDLLKAGDQ